MDVAQFQFLRTVAQNLQKVRSALNSEVLAVPLRKAVSGIRSHKHAPLIGGLSLSSGLAAYGGYFFAARSRQSRNTFELPYVPQLEYFGSPYEIEEPAICALGRFFDEMEMELLRNIPGTDDPQFYEQVFDDADLYVDRSSEYRLQNFIRMESRLSAIDAYMRTIRESEVKSVEWEELLTNLARMYGKTFALIKAGGFREI